MLNKLKIGEHSITAILWKEVEKQADYHIILYIKYRNTGFHSIGNINFIMKREIDVNYP